MEEIMVEVVQTNYTINGKTCFVIESYGEALDEFVYETEQDAIDAAELIADWPAKSKTYIPKEVSSYELLGDIEESSWPAVGTSGEPRKELYYV